MIDRSCTKAERFDIQEQMMKDALIGMHFHTGNTLRGNKNCTIKVYWMLFIIKKLYPFRNNLFSYRFHRANYEQFQK